MKFQLASKKGIIIGTIIVLVAGGGFFYAKTKSKAKESQGTMVSTAPISQKDIEEIISLKAPLEGTESAEIVSKLHYEVIKMNVQEGDIVKKGQILAVLDADELQKDIRKAEDDLNLMVLQNQESNTLDIQSAEQAQLDLDEKIKDQQEAYDKAVLDLNTKQRNYDNIKTLADSGAETQENLKVAKTDLDNAMLAVESFHIENGKVVPTEADKKALEKAATTSKASRDKQIEIARKEIQRKKEDLADCEIKSPIDGTITRVNIKRGRFADETDNDKPMFVVENINALQMKVLVSEYDIARIQVGQSVKISADILQGEEVTGEVTRISPTGELKEGSSTERVIPTFINVTGDTKGLIAGINAKADILIQNSENVLTIPMECLREKPDGTEEVLRVTSENKLEVIPVETGVQNDIEIEVISDKLQDGDNIVMMPSPDMIEGMDVLPAGI